MQYSTASCEPDAFVAVQVSDQPTPSSLPTVPTSYAPSFLPGFNFFGVYRVPVDVINAAKAMYNRSPPQRDNNDLC